MIEVVFSSGCQVLIDRLGLQPHQVVTTINDRHRGLVDNGLTNIIAVHWFSDEDIVLAQAVVAQKEADEERSQVRFKQVTAQLAMKLRPTLPAGRIGREMNIEGILQVVAQSFGHPVTCHPDVPPVPLYRGKWDGKAVDISVAGPASEVYVSGSFSPSAGTCELVWALDLNRYLEWLGSTQDSIEPGSAGRDRITRVKFSTLYDDAFQTIVSKRAVERVVKDPDKVESLETGDGRIARIRSKLVQDEERGPHFIVVTTLDDAGVATFTGGFRIREDVTDDAGSLRPAGLLRALAERVGLELKVGDFAGRFVEEAQVRVDRNDVEAVFDSLGIQQREGHPLLMWGTFRFRELRPGPGYEVDLRDWFCVDRFEYLRWMREGRSLPD